MRRIFLLNFPPDYCPSCGIEVGNWDALGMADFKAGCSHTCLECGVKYQYVPEKSLLVLADQHGDMMEYIDA